MINKIKQLLPSLLLCVTVSSCASYSAITLEPSEFIATQTEELESLDGVVTVRVYQDMEPVEQFYSQNLLAISILPIYLNIQNTDVDGVIEINPAWFKVVSAEGRRFSSLTIDQTIQRAQFGHGQTAAWTIGFGIIGAAISASNISNANAALSADYNEKGLNGALLQPGSSVQGTVFFLIDSKVDSLDGMFLELPLKNSIDESEVLSIALSGPIELGDPRSKNKPNSRFEDDGDPLTPASG